MTLEEALVLLEEAFTNVSIVHHSGTLPDKVDESLGYIYDDLDNLLSEYNKEDNE